VIATRGSVFAIFAALGCGVFASFAAAGAQQPTFRAATRLVEVSVVVHDRSGRPVSDLTASDFQVLDEGRPQAIELFSTRDERTPAGVASTISPGTAAPAVPAAEPGEYTNWRDTRSTSVSVILIDRVNSKDSDQLFVRKQIVKLLDQIQAHGRIALYMLEPSRIRVLHDFTTDPAALVQSLERYHTRSNGDPDGSRDVGPIDGDPDLDAFVAEMRTKAQGRAQVSQAQITAAGLETLGQHLAGIQGRKNLIWVTSAFPAIGVDELGRPRIHINEARRAMKMLSDANIAVYPIDDRGIAAYWVFDPAAPTPLVGQAAPNAPSGFASTAPNNDSMQIVAEATGGRVFTSNDIAGAVRRAIDDSAFTYVLGYYPPDVKWDDTFRRITVNVARPGVNVRYRTGYFATTAAPVLGLSTIARSPLDATALRLSVRLAGDGRARSATMRLPAGAIALTKQGDRWDGAVEILIAQSTPAGKFDTIFENTLHVRFSDEERDQIQREGFTVSRSFDVRPGVHQLHVVLRDATTGAAGSLRIPIQ
jgi:VWFA-related protein